MRLLYITMLALALICFNGCSAKGNKQQQTVQKQEVSKLEHYENEFYSLDYPSYWEHSEESREMQEVDDHNRSIGPVNVERHEVNFTNNDGVLVQITKSTMNLGGSVKDMADLSILLKGLANTGKYQGSIDSIAENYPNRYIDYYREEVTLDNGDPAEFIAFELVRPEVGDTLIHKQLVVQNKKRETFYVNSTFAKGNAYAEMMGDKILTSFKLK